MKERFIYLNRGVTGSVMHKENTIEEDIAF